MGHPISLERIALFQAAQYGQINDVLVFRARCQGRVEDDFVTGDVVHAERLTQRQPVLGQGTGLVRAQHVHARQFLDGRQPGHNRLFSGQQARADGHGHRQYRRHRHGNRGHGQHQCELKHGEDPIAAEKPNDDNHRHQRHGKDDQVIADLQHRALKVADGVRLPHQLCRPAKIGGNPGGIDQRLAFALANDRA